MMFTLGIFSLLEVSMTKKDGELKIFISSILCKIESFFCMLMECSTYACNAALPNKHIFPSQMQRQGIRCFYLPELQSSYNRSDLGDSIR